MKFNKEIHEKYYSFFIKEVDCKKECKVDMCDMVTEMECYIGWLENRHEILEEKYFKD